MRKLRYPVSLLILLLSLSISIESGVRPQRTGTFEISYPPALEPQPITGRVFVIISKNNRVEPRIQAGSYTGSAPFFGVDVNGLKPGQAAVVDSSALGYPINLNEFNH